MRAVGLLLLLAACGTATPEGSVNEADPAITDALADPIMADPRLALQDRGAAIGVPTGIDDAEHALTLGQIASARQHDASFAACNTKLTYGFAWMARLPADLALPDAARVSEAAGSNAPACKLRIVRFVIARPVAEIDAFYRKKSFQISTSNGAIMGVRAEDGATYWVSIVAVRSGAAVDLVTNGGT